MNSKAPRRTAERILETALELFNRFGEPNVSTTVVAAQLGISAGNLYYHYPAKEDIVNALCARYVASLDQMLPASQDARDVEGAWIFLHALFEHLWNYRFLYRDLNDLLSRNRTLEAQFGRVLANKMRALHELLTAMRASRAVQMAPEEIAGTATRMVVVLTYWLSFEYVRDPRHALEAEAVGQVLARGTHQVLQLLAPYLESQQRHHLMALAQPCEIVATPA